jgi:ABC-type dipeptide/oligopeptide/nickel transport system ATPase component
MILISHDLGVVAGHTDVVAVMYAGQMVERVDAVAVPRLPHALHSSSVSLRAEPARSASHTAARDFGTAAGHAAAAGRVPLQPALRLRD